MRKLITSILFVYLLLALFLSGCAPALAPVLPTETQIPATATQAPATHAGVLVNPENPIGIGGYWNSIGDQAYTVSLSDTDGHQALLEVQGRLSWDGAGNLTEGVQDIFRIQTNADPGTWYKIMQAELMDGLLLITAEEGTYTHFAEGYTATPAGGTTMQATLTADGNWKGQATFIITGFNSMDFSASIYQDIRNYQITR